MNVLLETTTTRNIRDGIDLGTAQRLQYPQATPDVLALADFYERPTPKKIEVRAMGI
jgi:hypothetical protein